DIYYFVLPKLEFDVSGIVWDKQTNSPVKGAKLSLLNTDNELISSLETTENGRYRFVLDNTSNYTIYLYHVDYKLEQAKIETINLQESKHFIKDFFLVK
ncbi:MAG TPA: carboxypeptidase-like regulatory domain-containing protein, partial [Bacteroidales bacterium]|nr:carboxypeptidase-like regulatory domain-containing protein [Bacteroidales bacterium]